MTAPANSTGGKITKPKVKVLKDNSSCSSKRSDEQVRAYIESAIDHNYQVPESPPVDPICGCYVGQRFEMVSDDVWNLVHIEAIEGNTLRMRWAGWFDEQWKFRLKFLNGVYYDEKGFVVDMVPERTHIVVYKAWIKLPSTKPPIHWPGKVYLRPPFQPRKKQALSWLKDETRMYVELYGNVASRPKLKPYSGGFWNSIGNIYPLTCAKVMHSFP